MENKEINLTADDIDELSEDKLEYAYLVYMKKSTGAVGEAVNAAMEGEDENIIKAMARPIPVYVSPQIRLIGDVTVQFRNVLSVQMDDVNSCVSEKIRNERGSVTNEDVAVYTQKLLLCHCVETYCGKPFGGQRLSDEFFDGFIASSKDAVETLKEFRNKRLSSLKLMDNSIVVVLSKAMRAFLSRYDAVLNLSSLSPEKAREKVKKIDETVKKSTGPLVVGQKPT